MDQSESSQPKRLRTLVYSAKFPGGNTFLHQFVLNNSDPNLSGSENFIRVVLSSLSDIPQDVLNALNGDGYCALHLAVLKKNHLMVKMLLSCFLDIDINKGCRRFGNTALHIAAELGHLPIIKELRKGLLNKRIFFYATNDEKETALFLAVRSGHLDATKCLVDYGADVNAQSVHRTPLCVAAEVGKLAIAEYLVRNGAESNNKFGMSALCCAAESKNLAILEFLVTNGAEVNEVDSKGITPLHYAVSSNSLAIVDILVNNGANIYALDQSERHPLHWAVCGGHLDIIKFFICQGAAHLHSIDEEGRTLLHWAVSFDQLEIVKLLIGAGADLHAVDEEGKTPLHHAKGGECAALLLDMGAYLHARDMHGFTPLLYALTNNRKEVIKVLRDRGAYRLLKANEKISLE